MTKEELILKLLNDGAEDLRKTLKTIENDIIVCDDLTRLSNLTYTQGYCIGHLALLGKINKLLNSDIEEISDIIIQNDIIKKNNRDTLDNILKRIKNGK